MPTERQIDLIEELMDEMAIDRADLADEDETWGVYERLDSDKAGELIEWLIEEKQYG